MKPITACIAISATLAFLVISTIAMMRSIELNQEVYGKLKQAADANTITLAKGKLEEVVQYLDKHNLTKGNSSILWNVPKNDLGFWYDNIKASLDELNSTPENASQLEVSNILIKLRESLIDHGEKGDTITAPNNLSFYPNHVAASFLTLLFLAVAVLAWDFFAILVKA